MHNGNAAAAACLFDTFKIQNAETQVILILRFYIRYNIIKPNTQFCNNGRMQEFQEPGHSGEEEANAAVKPFEKDLQ